MTRFDFLWQFCLPPAIWMIRVDGIPAAVIGGKGIKMIEELAFFLVVDVILRGRIIDGILAAVIGGKGIKMIEEPAFFLVVDVILRGRILDMEIGFRSVAMMSALSLSWSFQKVKKLCQESALLFRRSGNAIFLYLSAAASSNLLFNFL